MLRHPKLHPPSACVGEIRGLFLDDHVHMALLVDEGRLIAAVERADLPHAIDDEIPARLIGRLSGRTISPRATLDEAFTAMRDAGRRRLAAVDSEGAVVGLLCLRANGLGYCSDRDVECRSLGDATPPQRSTSTMHPEADPSTGFGATPATVPRGAAGPGGPAGLQSRSGRVTHGFVGSTPTPLRRNDAGGCRYG